MWIECTSRFGQIDCHGEETVSRRAQHWFFFELNENAIELIFARLRPRIKSRRGSSAAKFKWSEGKKRAVTHGNAPMFATELQADVAANLCSILAMSCHRCKSRRRAIPVLCPSRRCTPADMLMVYLVRTQSGDPLTCNLRKVTMSAVQFHFPVTPLVVVSGGSLAGRHASGAGWQMLSSASL